MWMGFRARPSNVGPYTHLGHKTLSNKTCCSPEPQRLPHSKLYLVAQNLADLWTHKSEASGKTAFRIPPTHLLQLLCAPGAHQSIPD